MSRVIKNNDGVTVVEGTPAASLVKDVDKFFAAKPPERKAGESIAAVRKDTFTEKGISRLSAEEKAAAIQKENELIMKLGGADVAADIQKENELRRRLQRGVGFTDKRITTGGRPVKDEPGFREETKGRNDRRNVRDARRDNSGRDPNARRDFTKRNQAKDKAESRRKRFFERRRSKKEAERSQTEQEATQGKFITTLGR